MGDPLASKVVETNRLNLIHYAGSLLYTNLISRVDV
jgi:hypothetical protein